MLILLFSWRTEEERFSRSPSRPHSGMCLSALRRHRTGKIHHFTFSPRETTHQHGANAAASLAIHFIPSIPLTRELNLTRRTAVPQSTASKNIFSLQRIKKAVKPVTEFYLLPVVILLEREVPQSAHVIPKDFSAHGRWNPV